MSSTIVRIRRAMTPGGTPSFSFSVDGPPTDDMMLTVDPALPPVGDFIALKSDPAVDAPVIEGTGQALRNDLARHQNLNPALAATLAALLDDPAREIQIEIQSVAKAAHNFPWEALHDPAAGFLALAPQVPITRIVPPAKPAALRGGDSFDGTLRLFAVIAAAGLPGGPEWQAIQDALARWPGPRDCRILVADPALRAQIDQAGVPGLTTGLVPGEVDPLLHAIADHRPQIVHFFCHGQSAMGGVLEFATAANPFGFAPLFVSPAQMAPALRSAWLVVLNACATGEADPAANTNSFACTLVEQGVPFVVSMRQEVPAQVAHCFAGSFLPRAIGDLAAVALPGAPFRLRFAPAIAASRAAIITWFNKGAIGATRVKEWTLPILCATPVPFEVRSLQALTPEEAAEARGSLRMLRKMLETGSWNDAQRAAIAYEIGTLEAKLGGAG